jgi:hypothetical protein
VSPRDRIKELERDARQAEAEGRDTRAFALRAAAEAIRDQLLNASAPAPKAA